MYERPHVVSYTREEIADLLGPVETQYCDVQVQPSHLEAGQSATLVVDFSGMPGFDTVMYEIMSDGMGREGGSIPRSAGSVSGTDWSVTEFVPREAYPGSYRIEVRLAEGGQIGEPCSTTIEISYERPDGEPEP